MQGRGEDSSGDREGSHTMPSHRVLDTQRAPCQALRTLLPFRHAAVCNRDGKRTDTRTSRTSPDRKQNLLLRSRRETAARCCTVCDTPPSTYYNHLQDFNLCEQRNILVQWNAEFGLARKAKMRRSAARGRGCAHTVVGRRRVSFFYSFFLARRQPSTQYAGGERVTGPAGRLHSSPTLSPPPKTRVCF